MGIIDLCTAERIFKDSKIKIIKKNYYKWDAKEHSIIDDDDDFDENIQNGELSEEEGEEYWPIYNDDDFHQNIQRDEYHPEFEWPNFHMDRNINPNK